MLTKIMALVRLPAPERKAKLQNALRDRTSLYIYKFLGEWLNGGKTRFVVDFRPDSHYNFNRFGDYELLLRGWLAGNQYNNCGDLSRFYTICLNVAQVLSEGVQGDFVELGVYKGNSASLLAAFARRENRQVFLFDTFGGFDQRDFQGVDSDRSVLFADTSVAGVQKLVGTDNVTYVQGFFPESTIKIRMPERVSVAHIDCDLYQPMKAGLELFYPRLSPGGLMLLHDYTSGHWPGVQQAIDEFFDKTVEKPVLVPDKSGTAIVRKALR
jgi:Macrocin-O-methyltransferase (TylF)